MKKTRFWWASAVIAALVICFLAFFSSMVSVGYAATIDAPNGLSANYDGGDGSWVWNPTTGQYTGSVKSDTKTCRGTTTYTPLTISLTLKNESDFEAQVNFSYSAASNSGSLKINGTSKTSAGTFDQAVAGKGGTIAIELTSSSSSDKIVTVTLSSFSVSVPDNNVTTTFSSSPLGSYTVSGDAGYSTTIQANGASVTHEQSNQKQYTLTAQPADGYQFVSWKSGGEAFSTQNPFTGTLGAGPITPYFVIFGAAKFQANGKEFYDLNEANTEAAAASTKTIKLVKSGVVPAGTYTIGSGVTLFLPTSPTDNTVKTTKPETEATAPSKDNTSLYPSEYLKLTLRPGVTINVSGSVSIPSLICRANGSEWTGAPIGPCSRIFMESNSEAVSKMNFASGAKLYCWGYIYGRGEIHMNSGSAVYESFQVPSWKGGTVMSNLINSAKSHKTFPCNSYYVQNIEASLFVHYAATETVYFCTTLDRFSLEESFTFISNSSGLFHVGEGGYVCKRYDSSLDRMIVEINGSATVSSFSFSVSAIIISVSINSKDYVLPIMPNMSIVILSGTTQLKAQSLSFWPSSELIIKKGATFKTDSSSKLYFYSYNEDTWGNYTSVSATSSKVSEIKYTASNGRADSTGYSEIRTISDYTSASIDVGGTLEIGSGAYSTVEWNKGRAPYTGDDANGYEYSSPALDPRNAPVCCLQGTGVVKVTGSMSNTDTLYELIDGSAQTFVSIPYQPALLSHGSYYGGATSVQAIASRGKYTFVLPESGDHTDDYTYGYWRVGSLDKQDVTFRFVDLDGNTLHSETKTEDDQFTMPDNSASWLPQSPYSVKAWRAPFDLALYMAGESVTITSSFDDLELTVFYGGWFVGAYYPRNIADGSPVTNALYRIPDNETEAYSPTESVTINPGDVCLFGSNSKLATVDPTDTSIAPRSDWVFHYSSSTYKKGDDQLYHLIFGVVQKNTGIVQSANDLYYFGDDYTAFCDGRYFIESQSGLLPSGCYFIDSNGVIDSRSVGVQLPTIVDGGFAYYVDEYQENALAKDWGLFALGGYLYYALPDGSIMASENQVGYKTFYVEKTNGCTANNLSVTAGLYYFDQNGHMYDSSFQIVTNGGNGQ